MWFLLTSAIATYWISAGVFAALDYWHERRGTLSQVKLGESNVINWPLYRRAAWDSLVIQVLVLAPMALMVELLGWYFDCFEHHLTIPQGVIRLLTAIFLEDMQFHVIHRWFHSPSMYGLYHKKHHELTEPFAAGALYGGKLENALINFLPVLSMPFVVHMDRGLMLPWTVLATSSAVASHSGYAIGSTEFHDAHHRCSMGNFGVGGFSDWLCGTTLPKLHVKSALNTVESTATGAAALDNVDNASS